MPATVCQAAQTRHGRVIADQSFATRIFLALHGLALPAVLDLCTAHQHRIRHHLLRPVLHLCAFDKFLLAGCHWSRYCGREPPDRIWCICLSGLLSWMVCRASLTFETSDSLTIPTGGYFLPRCSLQWTSLSSFLSAILVTSYAAELIAYKTKNVSLPRMVEVAGVV